MKASDWANFIWYAILIATFVVAVIWIVWDSWKGKGRLKLAFRKLGNWFKVAALRIAGDLRNLFKRPTTRRREEEEERERVEEYRRQVLMRHVCPVCSHRLMSVPAIKDVDGSEGNKFYCLNCGYSRVEKKDENDQELEA